MAQVNLPVMKQDFKLLQNKVVKTFIHLKQTFL